MSAGVWRTLWLASLSLALWVVGALEAAAPACAHDFRPVVLHVALIDDTHLRVAWIAPLDTPNPLSASNTVEPIAGEAPRQLHPIRPRLPEGCTPDGPPRVEVRNQDRRWDWTMTCTPDALTTLTLGVDGLERTRVDGLIRFEDSHGALETHRVTGRNPTWTLERSHVSPLIARWGVGVTYIVLGVEHILLGPDHLIFVLLLVLLVPHRRALIATITGFTVGHSVTLVAAVMGWVNIPIGPVEALIALSILQLAVEVVQQRPERPSPIAHRPWFVSGVFGLLHGLGFAGAISDTGLPEQGLPLALFTFNVGVELGQLAFVAVVWFGLWALRSAPRRAVVSRGLAWASGLIAGFWVVERSVAVFSGG
jgi:hypothetical protein